MRTRKLFTTLAILFAALLVGCSGGKNQDKTVSVDDLFANPDSFIEQTVIVEGTCTHVCSKSGMKLFIEGENSDQTLRVESNSTLGKFDPESVDKKVRIEGKFVEERIDEEDLQEMEREIMEGENIEHGEGGEGCATEQKAEGITQGSSAMDRVNDFRVRIAERMEKEGKNYLSFYYIEAESCRVIE